MKRVGIYLRVSTGGQTTENQRRELEAVAARSGWPVVGLYEDAGISGAKYEQPLTVGNSTKYPDFTIEDMESGENYYWEHCGMLHVPQYRRRWEEKISWYRANGILPSEEGGGQRGVLIVTRDGANGSIDAANIDQVIAEILKR